MRRIKYILIILIVALFSACIKTYEPEIVSNDFSNYVVSGRVTSQEGFQYVSVSKTTPLNTYTENPVSDCIVTILDEKSNAFHCEEYEAGKYRVWMNKSSLKIGTSYMLNVETNEGERLVSDYVEMLSVGDIDAVSYERKNMPILFSVLPDSIKGIQFYIDVHGDNQDSKFYKIELSETWEYRVDQPMKIMYDGTEVHYYDPPDSSRMICWRTINISNLFLVSAEYLSNNEYREPINFVSNKTQRLKYLYSLNINQYSLTKDTYTYWEQLEKNNSQNGGLYVSQPIKIQGNICDFNNPEKFVLGMFYATDVVTKRIFVKDVENLENDAPKCAVVPLRGGLYSLSIDDYPAYLTSSLYGLLTLPCTDCLRMGGTTNKPDFWPN
jgi:hypothetical protein